VTLNSPCTMHRTGKIKLTSWAQQHQKKTDFPEVLTFFSKRNKIVPHSSSDRDSSSAVLSCVSAENCVSRQQHDRT
jgi:hypothetical protein